MTSRHLIVAAAVGALVSGCGHASASAPSTPSPTTSVSATPTPSSRVDAPSHEALRRLASAQHALSAAHAVVVRGTTTTKEGSGGFRISADVTSGSFFGTVTGGSERFDIRRTNNLTWVRAGAAFWIDAGYTKASSQGAAGMWTVFDTAGGNRLAGQYGPQGVIDAVAAIKPAQVTAAHRVVRDGRPAYRLRSADTAGAFDVFVSASGTPRVLELRTVGRSVSARTVFVRFPSTIHVAVPDADDVYDPTTSQEK